jgi:hypothetical protein
MTAYAEFLASKRKSAHEIGPIIEAADIHPMLHDWQVYLVQWAARVGRAAIWANTGMGKTFMQVEWARIVRCEGAALILAPLAVCRQTIREAAKIGVTVTYVRDAIPGPGIWISNYEMAGQFDPDDLAAVVLDESSILKQADGKTRNRLIEQFADVPYRLACTATPAPNDPEELTSQAEFLGQSTRANMLAAYFVHDDSGWRLKGHARGAMFAWMSTWAVALRKPSDLGYSDAGYDLPGLDIIGEPVESSIQAEGQLFATDLGGVGGRASVRRQTLDARCARAAALVANEPGEPWLIWCGLNDEAERLSKLIPGSVNVHGAWSPEDKARALLAFSDGGIRYLITKPSIASLGMNWQHCARMIFVGMNDSWEQYFQAIRRCYRYGQTRRVRVHIVLSDLEQQIAGNVARKERDADAMTADLVTAMAITHSKGVLV